MYPFTSHPYTPLPQTQPPKTSPSKLCLVSRYLLIGLLSSLAIAIAATATILLLSPSSSSSTARHRNCGTSPSTARSRGCHFDILSYAWQTPECFDADLIASFLDHHHHHHQKNWTFYPHFNSTADPVDITEAMEGNRNILYVDWRFHVVHCTFVWRQMHRALLARRRGYVDSHLGSYKHTLHCQRVLLDRDTAMESVVVAAELEYPECWEVGGEEWRGSVSGVS